MTKRIASGCWADADSVTTEVDQRVAETELPLPRQRPPRDIAIGPESVSQVAHPILQKGDDIAIALARKATQRRVDEHGELCFVAWDASGSTPMVDYRTALHRRSLRTG
jgi:hypothetical protein